MRISLLKDDPESGAMLLQLAGILESVGRRIADGDHAGAAKQFVDEVAFGPGAWDQLPPQVKEPLVRNAPTFLDELQDQTQVHIDEESLLNLTMPVRLTRGSESPPMFAP
jgi:hypothetical protein